MYSLKRERPGHPWHVYFLTRDGKRFRRSTKRKDKAEARAVADKLYQRHADPTYSAAEATTVREAAERFMSVLVQEGKPAGTQRFYAEKCGHVCRVFGEALPLAKVDARSVDDFIAQRGGEGAKPSTIYKELVALRRMLKHARRRGEFDKEVSQVMPVSFDPQYTPRTRWISIAEAWRLIEAVPRDVGRYIAFTLATSSRDAGARRAIGSDFDRVAQRIRVRDRKTALASREVPVVSLTAPFVGYAFLGLKPGANVFAGSYGGALHAMQRACKRLGIEPVTSNDLRRSLAHWMRDAGVPRDIAGEFFAHTDERMMAKVYGRLDAGELEKQISRILDKSWKNGADPVDTTDASDIKKPGKGGGSGGSSGGGGRLCNPLPNHLATSPDRRNGSRDDASLEAVWIDLHLQRRIQELRARAALDELIVVLVRECVALTRSGTQEAEAGVRARLARIAELTRGGES